MKDSFSARIGRGMVAAWLLLLAGCGTMSVSLVETDDTAARDFVRRGRDLESEVKSLAKPLVDSGETPGIVVGVLQPGSGQGWSMRFFGYGQRALNAPAPDGDTLFATGSLSKGFLGALTAILVEEGVLSWRETLATLLSPEVALSPDARRITLEQLATHTSGLPRQPMDKEVFAAFLRFLFEGENFYRSLDRDDRFPYLADFKAPAQTEVIYSNIGYGILGLVIERKTGKTLDELLASRLLKPLALEHTGYLPESLPDYGRRALGHAGQQPKFMARGTSVPEWKFSGMMKGSAGVYSSARDLLQFAAAHMHAQTPVRQRALLDTLQVRVPREHDAPAVAWFVDDFGSQRITYQVGFHAGYSCYLGMDTERRLAVVVLQNAFNWTDSVGHRLLMRLARADALSPEH